MEVKEKTVRDMPMPGEEMDVGLMPGEEMTGTGIEGTEMPGEGTGAVGFMPGEGVMETGIGILSEPEMAEAVAEGLEAFELAGTWKTSFFLDSPKRP